MRVQVAPRARLDLIQIGDYLECESGKRTALRWVERLEKKALSLGQQPMPALKMPILADVGDLWCVPI